MTLVGFELCEPLAAAPRIRMSLGCGWGYASNVGTVDGTANNEIK